MSRNALIERNTLETKVKIELEIEGKGNLTGETGIGFFDHMLNLLTKHGNFNIKLDVQGDTFIDNHHLIEDIGIVLGELFSKTLGDKKGINRYGSFTCPMDETLTTVNLDFGGRGYLVYNVDLKREMVGNFETEMLKEFLYAFCINGKFNLHVNTHYGENDHHKIESIFKALGRSLKEACKIESENLGIPSTKGVI